MRTKINEKRSIHRLFNKLYIFHNILIIFQIITTIFCFVVRFHEQFDCNFFLKEITREKNDITPPLFHYLIPSPLLLSWKYDEIKGGAQSGKS